jgi:hypothetical protein
MLWNDCPKRNHIRSVPGLQPVTARHATGNAYRPRLCKNVWRFFQIAQKGQKTPTWFGAAKIRHANFSELIYSEVQFVFTQPRPVAGIRDRRLPSNQFANFPKNKHWRQCAATDYFNLSQTSVRTVCFPVAGSFDGWVTRVSWSPSNL